MKKEAVLMRRVSALPILAFALAAASLAAPLAQADSYRGSGCLDSRKLEDWKSPDPKVIYYRVGASDIYRLDLWTGSNQLQYSDVRLFDNHLSPSQWICTPQDFNLRVTDSHHTFVEPLIVKSITRLTPDEVAAIPPQFRP
jgi:hypothetical protein